MPFLGYLFPDLQLAGLQTASEDWQTLLILLQLAEHVIRQS